MPICIIILVLLFPLFFFQKINLYIKKIDQGKQLSWVAFPQSKKGDVFSVSNLSK